MDFGALRPFRDRGAWFVHPFVLVGHILVESGGRPTCLTRTLIPATRRRPQHWLVEMGLFQVSEEEFDDAKMNRHVSKDAIFTMAGSVQSGLLLYEHHFEHTHGDCLFTRSLAAYARFSMGSGMYARMYDDSEWILGNIESRVHQLVEDRRARRAVSLGHMLSRAEHAYKTRELRTALGGAFLEVV